MRFAAIADIHGNVLALEAVLADIQSLGISEVVNLGDHFSGPLEAGKTADILLQRRFPSIRGNHDRQLIQMRPDQMGASDRAAHAQLNATHLAWLTELPPTVMYRDEVFMCHGTPRSDTTYWLESVRVDAVITAATIEVIEKEAAGIEASLILCGHTHIPRVVRLRDGRMIVNPGSVGCPAYTDDLPVAHLMQTGTPDACYAIVSRQRSGWSVTFPHVSYDHSAMAELAMKNRRAEWASALATGWIPQTPKLESN